ncbi:MAG: S1 RNA-binding domain-containing protein [Parcubacteria group bacterium]|nr:S1 RNA-binding domain-containing protein [Parcubacteria group bacterium]
MAEKETEKTTITSDFQNTSFVLPKEGDVVDCQIIEIGKNQMFVDISGIFSGVIRGVELSDELKRAVEYSINDIIRAKIISLENENGVIELSLRQVDNKNIDERIRDMIDNRETIVVEIVNANIGGLMVHIGKLKGFIPASQLAPSHYPRVGEGEKMKILEQLKKLVGQTMRVKIIAYSDKDGKLVFSEKEVFNEENDVRKKYQVGQVVDGVVTSISGFGAFVKFDDLEGLVHISELSWKRLEHPSQVVRVGQRVSVQITNVENGRIALSMKNLQQDPWKSIAEKYKTGDEIDGKVIRVAQFGLLVEVEPDISGLCHFSEFPDTVADPSKMAKTGDVMKFRIIDFSTENHRMGLSLKKGTKSPVQETEQEIIKEDMQETTQVTEV